VGALVWTRRQLRDSDRELLAGVAGQLGSVVHAEGLLASVKAAQERLVLAREEERRRLRRDLHDGLGPSLAALTLQVDTLRNLLPQGMAQEALLDLRSRIQDTVVDVRRIVEGLQPATLDDIGLEASVRQLTERFARDGSLEVNVDVEALPALPAAVEVGAYRIVQESLANVVRHADASSVKVGLRLGAECLEVCVSDDGNGHSRQRPHGVGLESMRARAEEIGGQFEYNGTPGSGTTVRARLPLTTAAGP
jgi:signal transduction histidine kinase